MRDDDRDSDLDDRADRRFHDRSADRFADHADDRRAGSAPRRLAEGLDRVLAGLGRPSRGGLSRGGPGGSRGAGSSGLFARWGDIVGPEIAAHARPLGVRDGELVVVVDDPAWASQMRWLGPDLLARIASSGGPELGGLRVRVKPR
jgi:hypothetical protein